MKYLVRKDDGVEQECPTRNDLQEGSERPAGPNPMVAGIIFGALGLMVGAVAGVFSLGLLIDGLVINGTRVSPGEQILICASVGAVLGGVIGGGIATFKSKSG